jgi:PAS domain S-box-containing protein
MSVGDPEQTGGTLGTNDSGVRQIADAMPVLASTLNARCEVELATPALLNYFGITLDELKNWATIGVVHPDDLEAVIAKTSHSADTGEPFDFEHRCRRFDGVFRRLQARGIPFRNPQGQIERWCALLTDVEDQRQAEEALRTSERSLNLIINTIPELAWSADSDGTIDFLNQRWLNYTGFSADQALGWKWMNALHPDEIGGLTAHWKSIMMSKTPGEIEARLRRFDGVYRWFLFRAVPVKDESGRVIKWYGLNTDIEDRRRNEDALRMRELSFQLVVDSIPVPVAVTTPTGEVEYLNQLTLDYFDKTLEELKRWETAVDIIHPNDLEATVAVQKEAHRAGRSYSHEVRHRRADGVYRWFNNLGLPLRDTDGHILRWFSLQIDIDDRKRAEEALRASELNLRQIVDSIPGLVCTMNSAGEFQLFNRQLLMYFGKSAEELQGWATSDAVHPDDRPSAVPKFIHAITTGEPYENELRCRRADGAYRWFQVRGLPVRDADDQITGWYVLLTDIDDRKRAEEALKASERNLAQIINTIPTTAWSTRPDGFCDFLSDRWLDYAGFTYEEAVGWRWASAIHPDDAAGLQEHWLGCLATGTPVNTEARIRRFDGVYRWFLFLAQPFRDESGTIVKWYGTNVDIEDRKRADAELRRSEAFLSQALNVSSTGSFSWRVDTGEIKWSKQLYRIFGFHEGMPLTAERVYSRVHPEDFTLLHEKVEQARRDGSPIEYEHRLLMPDQSIKYVNMVAHATTDANGRLEYFGAVQDVTARRNSEEALSKVRSELAHVARVTSLGALTASIAHEINQPLAGIITNAETCLQMLDDIPPDIEGARETALRSIRDGNRASDVIARLRSLFKRKDFVSETIDLNEAAREVIALSAGELRRNRVVFRMNLAEDLPPVTGDRVQLQQVIINLLRNAIDAMREVEGRPRQLLIQTERDGGENVRLSVQDTGIGFVPKTADRLFDSFYSTKDDGMGIGLAISRSIIEAHHGKIWATLNHGPGSTFVFSIHRGFSDIQRDGQRVVSAAEIESN